MKLKVLPEQKAKYEVQLRRLENLGWTHTIELRAKRDSILIVLQSSDGRTRERLLGYDPVQGIYLGGILEWFIEEALEVWQHEDLLVDVEI